MPLFCWLFLFASCSKIKDIHFILQRFQNKNFLFFESVEKSFTSVRKCAILYESPIEVWLSLVEHYVRDVGAASSNLVTSTNYRRLNYEKKLVIQPFFVTWGGFAKNRFFPKMASKYGQMASKMASGKRSVCASCWNFWSCLALSNQERRQMDLNKNMKSIQPIDPVITLPAYPNQRQYRAKSPDALCAVLP